MSASVCILALCLVLFRDFVEVDWYRRYPTAICGQCRRTADLALVFTARRSYASAVLGVVILSVRLSHACFVTNPKNLPAIFLYRMKGQSL